METPRATPKVAAPTSRWRRVARLAGPGLAALLVLAGAPAWPCSLAGESPRLRFVSPAPASRGVPRNAEVKLFLSGPRPDGETFTLRDETAGVELEVGVSSVVDVAPDRQVDHRLVRLRPAAPLAARHAYVVAWNRREVTRFEVGAGGDEAGPGAPGRVSADFEAKESSCFGDTRRYDLAFSDAEDGATPAGQLVYLARLAEPGGRVVPLTPADRWLGRQGSSGNLAVAEPVALVGELVALDWAGNESPPRAFALSSGLALTPPARLWRALPETVQLVAGGACLLGLLAAAGLVGVALRRPRRPA